MEFDLLQSDIAKELGIAKNTYLFKENGITEFGRDELEKLKNLLKLSPEDMDAIFFKS